MKTISTATAAALAFGCVVCATAIPAQVASGVAGAPPVPTVFSAGSSPQNMQNPTSVTDGAATPPAPLTHTVVNDAAWTPMSVDVSHARGSFPARLINLSARAPVGTADGTLIVGATIDGPATLPVLVRAIGPGLAEFGMSQALKTAPELTVFNGDRAVAQTNTIVGPAPEVASYVGAFPALASSDGIATGDAELVGNPAAGLLTVHCTGEDGGSGTAMLELYDADPGGSATSARLTNMSARGSTGGGDGVMIVGFVIAGEGQATLLLRGVGPSLAQFGIARPAGHPVIELYSSDRQIAANSGWTSGGTDAAAALEAATRTAGAFPLGSPDDSALLVNLPAGSYTLQIRDESPAADAGSGGVALGEVYQVGSATPSETFDAATATNAAGLDIYRQLAAGSPAGNLVISPYSIETALAMAYAGAEGGNRTEMARVLHFPSDNASLVQGFGVLRDALLGVAKDSIAIAQARSAHGDSFDPIAWQAANRIYGQSGYPFADSYLALLNNGFDAPLQQVDFVGDTENARQTINAWVAGVTNDRILDLIPPGGVNHDTRLALVNALYLKAPWDTPFGKALTAPLPFHLADGTTTDVPTMQRADYLGYASENGSTIVTLPYLGGELQFVIILPAETDSVDALAARLTAADFARWSKLESTDYIALQLPKFTLSGSTVALGTALRALGMTTAFTDGADFHGIAPPSAASVAIQDVFHKTFIAVDEQGTEAAAATAVSMGVTVITVTPEPIAVHVDRPFLFAIQHRASGACLFIGRIDDPG